MHLYAGMRSGSLAVEYDSVPKLTVSNSLTESHAGGIFEKILRPVDRAGH